MLEINELYNRTKTSPVEHTVSGNQPNMTRIQAVFGQTDYGPGCRELLSHSRPMALGPAAPQASITGPMRQLHDSHLLGGNTPKVQSAFRCCLAALWLRFDHFDESHTISQQIETAEGSYWHAILHRRELDFSNSKYWYRRVVKHPVDSFLHTFTEELTPADRNVDRWDPCWFVDCCQLALGSPAQSASMSANICLEIAEWEWWLLFDYCFGLATEQPTAIDWNRN